MSEKDDGSLNSIGGAEQFESAAEGPKRSSLITELQAKLHEFLEGLQKEKLISNFGNMDQYFAHGVSDTSYTKYALFGLIPNTAGKRCMGFIKITADDPKAVSLHFEDAPLFYRADRLFERDALLPDFKIVPANADSPEMNKFFVAVKKALEIIDQAPGIGMMPTVQKLH